MKPCYEIDGASGCWNWLGYVAPNGYGLQTVGGKTTTAHRTAYVEAFGPIADDLHVDHLCRNTRCVNPAHLEAVTPTENIRRSTRTHLSASAVRTICDERTPAPDIARRFDLSVAAVYKIRAGLRWRLPDFEPKGPGYYNGHDEQVSETVRLRHAGLSYAAIGRALGLTGEGVRQRLLHAEPERVAA